MDDLIYFDNAATSWPKPACVAAAMTHFINEIGANPGRSGHRLSIAAAHVVYDAREAIAALFNAPDALQVVFGANITEALNLALCGYLRPGDHVITSSMEHNSVMRPLRALEVAGVQLSVVGCDAGGQLDTGAIEAAIRPETVMIVLNHASNVCGSLLPVSDVAEIVRNHELLLMVDTAQTGGAYPIDMQAQKIDLLAFTGHKGLLGPMGTGGLVIGERVDLARWQPLKRGGTGSHSEYECQPEFLPDMFESGTSNACGLAGLAASVRWILEKGVQNIRAHEEALARQMLQGLQQIPGVTLHGGMDATMQTATISFNIDGLQPSEVGLRLDEEANVLCRVGLHCSPGAHRTLGTFPIGSVRFGLGYFNSADQVVHALQKVRQLAQAV